MAEWKAVRQPGVGVLAEALALRRIIAEVKPDVVHLHCAKAGLAGRLVLRGSVPTVFSPHAWSFFAVGGVMRRIVLGWERFAARRWTSAAVCVSAAERESGAAAGIDGRLVVLPNEVSPSAADVYRAQPRSEIRASLGVEPGVPLAVCAARLVRQKGQDVLVSAWPAVRAAVPGAVLVLVGDGPDRAALEAIASDGVVFAGSADRDDAMRWMYAADLVVCPSRWEGMSLVPLEAMALGRPLVVTDVDGMAEVVPPSAARIVPVDDSGSLAAAVAELLGDTDAAEKAGYAGREHVVSGGASHGSADRLLALYRELTT